MCKDSNPQKDNKERDNMDTAVRYCPVSESLEDSLKQMKAIREGTLPAKTWRDFSKQLQEEDRKDK